MTTQSIPHESKMLTEVRRWRREAYEADLARTPDQRLELLKQLIRQFGLTKTTAGEPRSPGNPPTQ